MRWFPAQATDWEAFMPFIHIRKEDPQAWPVSQVKALWREP